MPDFVIAVIGPGRTDAPLAAAAREVGAALAEAGATVVCGGLGGVMEAVAEGVRAGGGTVVGILPGDDRAAGNRHLTVAIATGLGETRNALVVRAADAVIAVGGEYGTLSEIAFGLKLGRPVVGLDTWEIGKAGRADPGILRAADPAEAVAMALAAAARQTPRRASQRP
jgi:hypothetical protein